ncbi:6-hydroxymethylpterin diphosphokinase MptE-like protein [Paenibacillus sp. PAMC21692]|uniref:6-hydroxymethylpterin diphosphokinase MptE-like protein n=1 Tax=Paenibacillus sp. PAMC21692 TaxID=2762320 RepID=UPI00164D0725|nr:6-hydroxymethylpterin diphosphokinase MptE-like protein [Paenibacillus sp. PAMC21692]QNK58370.1 DUF115 domain-containing protein [Paenibacillus sp. PAMC21692]
MKKKIVVFGTGEYSRRFLMVKDEISYYVDNDESKWGGKHQEKGIYPPAQLLSEKKTNLVITIASMYYRQIAQQLKELGFIEGEHFYKADSVLESLGIFRKVSLYKNKHKGGRAFIIGNGPSLTGSDLSLIKNEISFASNQIYLVYEQTDWRPTYYTMIDIYVARNISREVQHIDAPKFCAHPTLSALGPMCNTYWLHEKIVLDEEKKRLPPPFSEDVSHVIYDGSTVTYFSLQLAYYMGFSEIILLGIDFNYPGISLDTENNATYKKNVEQTASHFHRDYHKVGEQNHIPRLNEMYNAYKSANDFLKSKGVSVYNASRKTKLDIFELVRLEDWIR